MQYIDDFFGYEELEIKNNDGTDTTSTEEEADEDQDVMYHPRYDSGADFHEMYDEDARTATGSSLGMHIV